MRLERADLAAADGQLHLDFETADEADEPPATLRRHAGPSTAPEWFEQGVEQEQAGYLAEAAESYRQALQVGGPDARVCFELANVLSALVTLPPVKATDVIRSPARVMRWVNRLCRTPGTFPPYRGGRSRTPHTSLG